MAKSEYKSPSKYLNAVASGGGRPKLILNEEGKQLVEILAGYMCTDEEIAASLHTTVNVLTNANNKETFGECKKRGVDAGKASLRRKQFKLAERNASMAIFLGKNYLGQKDYPDTDDIESVIQRANQHIVSLAGMIAQAAPPQKIMDLLDGDEA